MFKTDPSDRGNQPIASTTLETSPDTCDLLSSIVTQSTPLVASKVYYSPKCVVFYKVLINKNQI
jgi:hypothetical protein